LGLTHSRSSYCSTLVVSHPIATIILQRYARLLHHRTTNGGVARVLRPGIREARSSLEKEVALHHGTLLMTAPSTSGRSLALKPRLSFHHIYCDATRRIMECTGTSFGRLWNQPNQCERCPLLANPFSICESQEGNAMLTWSLLRGAKFIEHVVWVRILMTLSNEHNGQRSSAGAVAM
jgi:hypothetical protein